MLGINIFFFEIYNSKGFLLIGKIRLEGRIFFDEIVLDCPDILELYIPTTK